MPEPTSAPAPTAAPVAGVLPAPLYLFSDQQQIMRLDQDGQSVAQVTQEKDVIRQFSISPIDGSLLYVVGQRPNQQLVRSDAQGGNRVELLKGSLFSPVWSPDGQSYAVAWEEGPAGAGIYTAPATGGKPALRVANLPRPKDGSKPGQSYAPLAWSPNGQRLLMIEVPDFGPDAAAGDISVLGLAVSSNDQAPVELVSPGGKPYHCFDPSWSADSAEVLCANYGASGGAPGLWRIAANGGEPEVLLNSQGSDEQLDVFNARQIGDQVYTFVGRFKNGTTQPVYTMERLGAAGTEPVRLRNDDFDATAVIWSLWAPDGRGAVLQVAEQNQASNALIWTPANGDAQVKLGARAFGQPQWGIAGGR